MNHVTCINCEEFIKIIYIFILADMKTGDKAVIKECM